MKPYYHAVSSARKFGGEPHDYVEIHSWFDESKAHMAELRHRALRHHSQGIFECERQFGITIVNADGRTVPVRAVGEQHVMEDLGRIPSLQDWLGEIRPTEWMLRGYAQESDFMDSIFANKIEDEIVAEK
jgi:hypothetical protein